MVAGLVAGMVSITGPALAQAAEVPSVVDGRLIRPGTDTLASYLVRGTDTVLTGMIIDELKVLERDGRGVLQRVYRSMDQALGSRLDTLVDVHKTLVPVAHRSLSDRMAESLDFADGRVSGSLLLANGVSVPVDMPLPPLTYNSSSFDLVLRASPLEEDWAATVPVFLPNTRASVDLRARVTGMEAIDGAACWRVEAEFTGMPVTFWVDAETRTLRRQVMLVRPDLEVLYMRPKARGRPDSAS